MMVKSAPNCGEADLVFCSTPYQIFSALNMRLAGILSDDTDIVVFDYADGIELICENLKKSKLFRDVKYSHTKDCFRRCTSGKIKGFLWNCLYVIIGKWYYNKIGFNKSYDRVFYSFADPSVVASCRYLKKQNSKIEFIGFEDGLSNYYNKSNFYIQKNIYKIFRIPKEIYFRKTTYLYCPSAAPEYDDGYEKCTLPNMICVGDNKAIFNMVFGWEDKHRITNKIVYFDQLPNKRVGATDDFNIDVADIISRFSDDYIIKLHPRRSDNIYKARDMHTYEACHVPYEIIALNSLETKHVYVTNISSACFMPKLIFDLEPYVIFTFLIQHSEHDRAVMEFLERFKELYSSTDKLFFPKTMEEFESILRNIDIE